MNAIVTVSSKNQITLPATMAAVLGVGRGSRLWVKVKNNTVVLEKEPTWDDLQGSLADHPLSQKYSTLEVIKMAKEIEAKRLAEKYAK